MNNYANDYDLLLMSENDIIKIYKSDNASLNLKNTKSCKYYWTLFREEF